MCDIRTVSLCCGTMLRLLGFGYLTNYHAIGAQPRPACAETKRRCPQCMMPPHGRRRVANERQRTTAAKRGNWLAYSVKLHLHSS